jgi:hypothetical protein
MYFNTTGMPTIASFEITRQPRASNTLPLYAQTKGIICRMLYQSFRFLLAFSVRPMMVADRIDLCASRKLQCDEIAGFSIQHETR